MNFIIEALSPLELTSVIILTAIGFTSLGVFIIHKIFATRLLEENNDRITTGALVISSTYSVLIAFIIVSSWQNFDKIRQCIDTEANCIVLLNQCSGSFEQSLQDKIAMELTAYVNFVVNDEWKLLENGQESYQARDSIKNLWHLYTQYEPKTEKERTFLLESIQRLMDFRQARVTRIASSQKRMDPAFWCILLIGGISTIFMTCLLPSKSLFLSVVVSSLYVVVLTLFLFLIVLYNTPFSGGSLAWLSVPPDTFKELLPL